MQKHKAVKKLKSKNSKPRRQRQQSFLIQGEESQMNRPFGGSMIRSHAKKKRAISTKHDIHIVLKSSHAIGGRSFLHPRHNKKVNAVVRKQASRQGVHLKDFANNGNHLHLRVRVSHRIYLQRFLRTICGLLPRIVCGCQKKKPLGFRFWDGLPFTRIIAAGRRTFVYIRRYFEKNRRQAQKKVLGFECFEEVYGFS
jgi:hypothetical protein